MAEIDREGSAALLEYVAEHSTIKQRNAIRERFQVTLDYLESDNHESYWSARLGCPHCGHSKEGNGFKCKTCKYTRAAKTLCDVVKGIPAPDKDNTYNGIGVCCSVPFQGVTNSEMCKHGYVGITLTAEAIEVFLEDNELEDRDEYEEELEKCKAFCRGHIEWTNDYEWEKYRV